MEFDESQKQRGLQKLRCSVQNYDWGRLGHESVVGKLFSLNSGADIDEAKPYAEFWMGTHDSGPSYVVNDVENGVSPCSGSAENVTLKSWIQQDPKLLGDTVVEKWGSNLPFLFKVLSVAKPLSIQAHPDKKLAEALHNSKPNIYKDDNHKPEMALALTDFEALCGFVSLEELSDVLQNVPEIVEMVGCAYRDEVLSISGEDQEEKGKTVLKSIFTELMSASKDVISEVLSKLTSRLNMSSQVRELKDKEKLVLRLAKQFPADIGVVATFLFNHVKLKPGEALCLGPNELHAYLYGDCIECMATSDNVVRAGFTEKDRDIPILCSMLAYKLGFPVILEGVHLNPYTRRYTPPFDEFEVDRCILPRGVSVVFPRVPGPSIFLVMAGEGAMHTVVVEGLVAENLVAEGHVLFAPARTEIKVTATTDLHLYRAGINSH